MAVVVPRVKPAGSGLEGLRTQSRGEGLIAFHLIIGGGRHGESLGQRGVSAAKVSMSFVAVKSPGADLVVDYATAAGTAGASDFTATNDTLTFPADTTTLTQTFTVPTTADDQVEGDETFTATLSASPSSPLPTGFTLGTTTATATITAGGSATVSISGGGAVTEGDEATFTVTLSGSPGADLVVDYATAAGTAGASDFMATNDTLTFPADTLTLTQTFTVPTTADDRGRR